ncbi:HAMP domain-containing sensor histidine kinase [Amycolatopsis sp.]|uniref:sensor histidine kinase n=1 Tax=Amycolatopsis sp. TaxID=37632 RepID=UPI002D7F09F5|nr:HAMP domain-containing sensor histidine kinase [Amycolatopsis sp.]HET6705440.1 HAMP domain-containing sensor histidine kinase [Amycolatopsis sp.]
MAVLVAAGVAARLVNNAAREVSRQSLADQADVVAGQIADTGPGSRTGLRKVTEVLRGQGVDTVLLRGNGELLGASTDAVRAARQAGLPSVTGDESAFKAVQVNGRTLLVELRGTGTKTGVALVREVETAKGTERTLFRNVLFSLAIGLGIAAVAGLLLARVLSRSLRRTAGVAGEMSRGRRDLRAPVEGPREVAEVATAVTTLAPALQYSESRQREFLLSVSHELRTPLTAVTGFAEAIADGVASGDDAVRAGRTIQREAARLSRLVEDLLELARLGADEFRLDMAVLDLAALVRDCAEVWQLRCAREDVALSASVSSSPVPVLADARRLRQVVDGLAENALRVTPAGAPMVFSLTVSGASASLSVRDGGPGLAPEDYPVAFERGVLNARYRDRRPVGSGIGLALVHGLVTRMGGTLTAGPAPEGGAAFTLTFPVRSAEQSGR